MYVINIKFCSWINNIEIACLLFKVVDGMLRGVVSTIAPVPCNTLLYSIHIKFAVLQYTKGDARKDTGSRKWAVHSA